MKRLLVVLLAAGLSGPPALAASYYLSPDVPTDDLLVPVTYLPWEIVRNDSGVYTTWLSLPPTTAVDSVHAMCNGEWLVSVEAPAELPPGGGVFYEPRDVIRYNAVASVYSLFFCGGPIGVPAGSDIDAAFLHDNDSSDLILSFDVPTDLTAIGGGVYDPADLVRFRHTSPGCAGWTLMGLFFDASTAVPPVPVSSVVTGADRRSVPTMLTFDVPTTLAATYLPGHVVAWNSMLPGFVLFDAPPWPPNRSSRIDAFSFLPDPGEVPTMHVDKSSLTLGDLTITWTVSISAGAEDYGIYEGSIVSPWTYNHASVVCTDSGTPLTEEITPSSGNRYYLVVALNPDLEGSYGRRSTGAERPQGSAPCRTAQGFDCP
jgi:hypothetical protein